MAVALKIENHVQFTGYIPYSALYEVLSTADLCVNPEYCNSFTDKSTMIKIMDYMSFGCPIVQFDTTEGRVTAQEAAVYIAENCGKRFASDH
jgi:glycosyltransferase involved in cell wall biosynthesis